MSPKKQIVKKMDPKVSPKGKGMLPPVVKTTGLGGQKKMGIQKKGY
jgi:hypothetical protein